MRVINQSTETVALDALRPHPRNPRQGNIGAIHDSITANGFYGQVVAQKSTGFILAGNHRWQAARKAGATEIPVTWVDVDDDHALRILLADNRTSDLGSYDERALAELLNELGDLTGTGYYAEDLAALLDQFDDPKFAPKERLQQAHNKAFVRPVITVEDAREVETALAKTGIAHRGEAFLAICRAYNQ